MFNDIFNTTRKALYIAEIGINHNGDMETARALIKAASQIKADAVKFQTFVPEHLYSIHTSSLLKNGQEGAPDNSQIDFFLKFVLKKSEYQALQNYAEGLGLVFFSSAFDTESVDLLQGIGVKLYKIASSEVTNLQLIQAVARTGRSAIMSTGISSEKEISLALDTFRAHSSAEIVLLHCVSLYPPEHDMANLDRIVSLRKRFGVEIGFSDHSRDFGACAVAAALGARIFEKHFKLTGGHNCPDRDVSLSPEEFKGMMDSVEKTISMLGSGTIGYSDAEGETARSARRSLFAKKFIQKGKRLEESDIIAQRPGTGIPPHLMSTIINRTCAKDIDKGSLIREEYLE